MTAFEALLLGVIQGLTEFFPVSSSGHLKLAESFLGFQGLDKFIFFDLICHLGTLFSIFYIFGKEIKELLLTNRERMWQLILATLPLFPLVLFMKPIKSLFDQPEYLGFFFLFTALFLFAGVRFAKPSANPRHKWRDALIIGSFQAVAILPGISRSGSTISTARLLGWSPEQALTFSFLLAIPAILGGTTLEVFKILTVAESELPPIAPLNYFLGALSSFIVGTLSLQLLKSLVKKHSFLYFSWYCLIVGILTLIAFHG